MIPPQWGRVLGSLLGFSGHPLFFHLEQPIPVNWDLVPISDGKAVPGVEAFGWEPPLGLEVLKSPAPVRVFSKNSSSPFRVVEFNLCGGAGVDCDTVEALGDFLNSPDDSSFPFTGFTAMTGFTFTLF